MPPSDKKAEITVPETRVLTMVWKCFKTPPQIDHVKLARIMGYGNTRSVQNILNSAKKKIENSDDGPATPSTSEPGAARGSRKRKTARKDEDDDISSAYSTPTKRARSKKSPLSYEDVADDDSEPDEKDKIKEEITDVEEHTSEGVVD
ncbi:hypothetical protein F5Y11DRAFT_304339 [Daldinia sp. FL1419]|nr:hypothetical protein F5Y11DRAFT_304339 [Daldinia sp. FL1419]